MTKAENFLRSVAPSGYQVCIWVEMRASPIAASISPDYSRDPWSTLTVEEQKKKRRKSKECKQFSKAGGLCRDPSDWTEICMYRYSSIHSFACVPCHHCLSGLLEQVTLGASHGGMLVEGAAERLVVSK